MSRFEDLLRKAELCYETSQKVRGKMRTLWQWKAKELREKAFNISIGEASQVVKNGSKSNL